MAARKANWMASLNVDPKKVSSKRFVVFFLLLLSVIWSTPFSSKETR